MFGVKLFIDQVSFMEIYNEVVNDLLSDPKTRPIGGLKVKAGVGWCLSTGWRLTW